MSIRILLADDHALFLQGLRALLEKEPDMVVTGEVRDGRDAVRAACAAPPNVILMDVTMPGLSGIEATRQIHAARPSVRVLCLSMHAERQFVAAALEAGAAGYLLKDCVLEELVQAIRHVHAGRCYLSPGVAGTVVEDYAAHLAGRKVSSPIPLSSREREVLQRIAEGQSVKEIAGHLNLSVKTVGSHRERIMEKLDIHTVAGLTKYAIRRGLTSVDEAGSS